MTTKKEQLDELRRRLFSRIKLDKLHWHDVDLGFRASVEVCAPVSVRPSYDEIKEFNLLFLAGKDSPPPIYVPVTKAETWELADHFKAFPLTQKVMDTIYKSSKFSKVPHHGGKFEAGEASDNFVDYSWYLYSSGGNHVKPFSGAIKLWILSNVRSVKSEKCNPPDYSKEDPSVNYGMYYPGHAKGRIQGAASCHDQRHHDYSQLLQYMRNLRIDGHPFDMGTALLTAHPGIWNEGAPYRITKSDLTYLPFVNPIGDASKRISDQMAGRWAVKYAADPETYVFKGNQVKWSDTKGQSGAGFWVERDNQIIISWMKSGSTEIWRQGPPVSATLNFGFKGQVSKI